MNQGKNRLSLSLSLVLCNALSVSQSALLVSLVMDIEDLAHPKHYHNTERRHPHQTPPSSAVRRRLPPPAAHAAPVAPVASPAGTHPAGPLPAIYVKNYGCSHNASDAEYMAGLLHEHGYAVVGERDRGSAALWLVNSCTVKNPSEQHLDSDLRRALELGVPVVVSGCVPQAEPTLHSLSRVSLIGVEQIDRVVDVVRSTLEGNVVRLVGRRAARPSLDLPKIRRNALVEIIPINTGCLGSCTYCKTVYARGRLGSYEPAAIVARARSALADGVKEIWLTSEDSGAYGRDLGTSLPELLRALLAVIPPDAMLRVGMTNPPYILEHLDAICELLNHPRCYAFLHVPIQSASDAVLGAMRREYTAADFRAVADALLAKVPGVTLATDVICGFPGETEEDHQKTLRLLRHYRLPVVNISQFYSRPKTPAARLEKLPTHVVKERTREASARFRSYATHAHLLGAEVRALVTDTNASSGGGARHELVLVAHTKAYVQLHLEMDEALMGCTVLARVVEVHKFHVVGVLIRVLEGAAAAAAAATTSTSCGGAGAAAAAGGGVAACAGFGDAAASVEEAEAASACCCGGEAACHEAAHATRCGCEAAASSCRLSLRASLAQEVAASNVPWAPMMLSLSSAVVALALVLASARRST